jgi:S-adenosylmethionine decarboxylase
MNLQQSQGREHSVNDCSNTARVAELSLTSGAEWIIDANGCEPAALTACDVIRSVCEAVIQDLKLTVVGQPQWHTFPGPGGVTGLYLLSESHLACHTYPEFGLATFNLYCCREHGSWDWSAQLRNRLRAADVVIHKVRRGIHHAVSATGEEAL